MKTHTTPYDTSPEENGRKQTEEFATEQNRHLYAVAPTNIIGSSILTAILICMLWEVTAHRNLLIWLGCQIAIIFLRVVVVYSYRKRASADTNNDFWRRIYIISMTLAGISWACAAFLLFPETSVTHQLFLTLLLAGNVAAASSSYGVEMRAYIFFSFPIFIALIVKILLQHTALHVTLSGMLVLLLIFLLKNIRQWNRTIQDSLTLKLENLDLRHYLGAEEKRIEALDERLRTEITERESTQDTLIAERNQLRILIDNLPDYIFVKDAEGRFLLVNEASLLSSGFSGVDAIAGKTDFDIFPTEFAEKYHADEQKVIRSGKALINYEESCIDLNTRVAVWRLTSKIPFRDSHGDVAGIVGITRDITARKLRENTFRQHNRELILLNHMSDLLQTCEVEEKTYHIMKSICSQLFASDAGCLYVLNSDQSQFEQVTSWGNLPGAVRTLSLENCSIATHDNNYCIVESGKDPICPHVSTAAQESGYICAPVSAPEAMMGILYIRLGHYESSSSNKEQAEAKRLLVIRIVRHYALFLSNLRLRETLRMEAIHDPLTHLYNRRYMEEFLSREILHAKRQNSSIGIILFDIDHFKHFNDNHGHEAGDVVLQALSRFIKSHIRNEDIPCRYGGEEFLLIIPDIPFSQAQRRAEELRSGVAALETIYEGILLKITISLGVAAIPDHGQEISQVINAADTALYQAKERGRNRVVSASAL